MEFWINLDNRGYGAKPQGAEIGSVVNRLKGVDSVTQLTAADLRAAIERGQSFTPGVLSGTKAGDWKLQQLYAIDVDNEDFLRDENGALIRENGKNKAVRVDNPTTPEQAAAILKQHGIMPLMMYHTFSSTPDWERFRVLILADEETRDSEKARSYTRRLAGIIPNADTAIHNLDRIMFAGRPDCVFQFDPEAVTPISALDQLPEIEEPKPEAKAAEKAPCDLYKGSIKPLEKIRARKQKAAPLTTAEMAQRLQNDIQNFDLMQFVLDNSDAQEVIVGNTHYANPCPVCGRASNNMQIKGAAWCCYDDFNTTGHKGGTIIDYLMAVYGLTKAQAMDTFEYDIMGYDPQEKKEAYRREREAEEEQQIDWAKAAEERRNRLTAQKAASLVADQAAAEQEQITPGADIDAFLNRVQTSEYKPLATGIEWFDNLLSGGVIPKTLMLLSAAPATGKTTLAQQLGEEMAEHGQPVLYLNLEMAADQMVAKALSYRLIKQNYPVDALTVLQGYKWTNEQKQRITEAAAAYKEISRPAYCSAGSDNIDVILSYIEQAALTAESKGEKAPAIILDYLHLVRTTERIEIAELIKKVLYGLKGYAIRHSTFCLAISAVSRTAARGRLGADSGRDTSNTEFSGDYMLSLNYDEIDNGHIDPENIDGKERLSQEKSATYRRMILRCDKNRFGLPERYEQLYFDAAHNIFYSKYSPIIPNREELKEFSQRSGATNRAGRKL